jgi:hypothetical protein
MPLLNAVVFKSRLFALAGGIEGEQLIHTADESLESMSALRSVEAVARTYRASALG